MTPRKAEGSCLSSKRSMTLGSEPVHVHSRMHENPTKDEIDL